MVKKWEVPITRYLIVGQYLKFVDQEPILKFVEKEAPSPFDPSPNAASAAPTVTAWLPMLHPLHACAATSLSLPAVPHLSPAGCCIEG